MSAQTIIDQPQETQSDDAQGGKTIELKWTVTFDLKFDVPHALTKDEFIENANGHLEWMHKDINEKFPKELLTTLDKYHLLRRETFKQQA